MISRLFAIFAFVFAVGLAGAAEPGTVGYPDNEDQSGTDNPYECENYDQALT